MEKPGAAERIAIIDEYGELDRRIAEFRPNMDRAKAIEKQIAAWYGESPAEESYVETGRQYIVQISARSHRRKITDKLKLYALLGKALFLQLATVTLEAIDKHIPAEQHAGILIEERTGERRVKAVARAKPIDTARLTPKKREAKAA